MADAFERLVDAVLAEGDAHQPHWTGGSMRGRGRGMLAIKRRDRRLTSVLGSYWGPDADPLRVQLALEDARFVAGVAHMVADQLGLGGEDRRRVAAAAVRQRVLAEREEALTDVDDAWQAWWPPAPGEEGHKKLHRFLTAWHTYLAGDP